MIFVAHDNTPADVLQALQDTGLEVSPFSLYEGGRERRGTIFDTTIEAAYQLAQDADPDVDRYELYGVGIESVQGIHLYSSEDEDIEPYFDDDEDDEYFADPVDDEEEEEDDSFFDVLAAAVRGQEAARDELNNAEPSPPVHPSVEEILGLDDEEEEPEPEEEESTMDAAVQAVMETADTSSTSRITVRKESWSGHEEYNDARPIFVEFAEAIEQSVSVHVPHGTPRPSYRPLETYDDDRVHVHIYSVPTPEVDFNQRVAGFRGREMRLRDYILLDEPHEDLMAEALGTVYGFTSTDGNSDLPAAYVFEDAVFITADVVHYPEDFEVLREILTEAATLFDQTPEERAERRREAKRKAIERGANEYANIVRRRAQGEIDRLRSEYESLNHSIETTAQTLINYRRRYETVGKQIMAYDDTLPDPEKYKHEYLKLMSLPKVKSAKMVAGKLLVYTENLYAYDNRTDAYHDIGEFRIEVNPGENTVRWYNQTRQVNGYAQNMQAPHVYEGGNACLGNFSEIQVSLFESYELATLATMAIAFVENANTDDPAGRHVSKWPEVDEDTARQFETAN